MREGHVISGAAGSAAADVRPELSHYREWPEVSPKTCLSKQTLVNVPKVPVATVVPFRVRD